MDENFTPIINKIEIDEKTAEPVIVQVPVDQLSQPATKKPKPSIEKDFSLREYGKQLVMTQVLGLYPDEKTTSKRQKTLKRIMVISFLVVILGVLAITFYHDFLSPSAIANPPKWSVILFIYLIVLIMNFFIASGSAKAFMLIPIIMPLAEIFQISPQLCIVAFAFGDGFSNVMYPTNPVLLISLGLADVSYGKWFKKSILFQICNILLTSGILLLGLAVGY